MCLKRDKAESGVRTAFHVKKPGRRFINQQGACQEAGRITAASRRGLCYSHSMTTRGRKDWRWISDDLDSHQQSSIPNGYFKTRLGSKTTTSTGGNEQSGGQVPSEN